MSQITIKVFDQKAKAVFTSNPYPARVEVMVELPRRSTDQKLQSVAQTVLEHFNRPEVRDALRNRTRREDEGEQK
jgi:hypothetical protein